MVLPMLGWAVTGMVFFIKPGYEDAYEILRLKTYPLDQGFSISTTNTWEELRIVNSILGAHALVKKDGQSYNLDPDSQQPAPLPGKDKLKILFEDVVSHNVERYGSVENIEGSTAHTSTGITIELNWHELRFNQTGPDQAVIDLLYRIHYLQWTPWSVVNQILGIIGLLLLVCLAAFGVRIYLANRE